ncbi:TPA_asm: P [Ocimum alphacytorhabdovirus 1]|nr:TPA_asm: P [Ocimum alphacytorhabdovirus 1]
MAQYSSDDEREDYSDIGDVHSSLNFAAVCDDNPCDDTIQSAEVPMVPLKMPTNKKEPKSKETAKVDTNDVLSNLRKISDEMGVPISVGMENQIRALSLSGENPTKENLMWYLRGYIVCQSSSVVPSIKDATSELRSEVKRLQISANDMGKSGKSIEKAANTLHDKIEQSSAVTRSIFDEALSNISDYVMATMDSLRESDNKIRPLSATESMHTTKVSIPVIKDDLQTEETKKVSIVVPEVINSPSGVGSSKSETSAKDDDVIATRKSIMLSLGYTTVFMKELTPNLIMAAIPPSLLAEIKGQRLTQKVRLALKDIIRANLIEATNKK